MNCSQYGVLYKYDYDTTIYHMIRIRNQIPSTSEDTRNPIVMIIPVLGKNTRAFSP
jgi:hypothetical protein